jgi:hypothetical protein
MSLDTMTAPGPQELQRKRDKLEELAKWLVDAWEQIRGAPEGDPHWAVYRRIEAEAERLRRGIEELEGQQASERLLTSVNSPSPSDDAEIVIETNAEGQEEQEKPEWLRAIEEQQHIFRAIWGNRTMAQRREALRQLELIAEGQDASALISASLKDDSDESAGHIAYWAIVSRHAAASGWAGLPDVTAASLDLLRRWYKRVVVNEKLDLPGRIPQLTCQEMRDVAVAKGEGPSLRRWDGIEQGNPFHSVRKDQKLLVFLDLPKLPDGKPVVSPTEVLASLGPESARLAIIVGSLVAEKQGEVVFPLDDLIDKMGWHPESSDRRDEMRKRLASWLDYLCSLRLVGNRTGTFTDRAGTTINTESHKPFLSVVSVDYPTAGQGMDTSVPVRITIGPGPWLQDKFKLPQEEQERVLQRIGDLRPMLDIPAGRAVGRWAQMLALTLNQLYRERKKKTKRELPLGKYVFSRGELFRYFGLDVEVEKLIESDNPGRVKTHWDKAIKLLKQNGVISECKPLTPVTKKRTRWKEDWKEQLVEITPGPRTLVELAKK